MRTFALVFVFIASSCARATPTQVSPDPVAKSEDAAVATEAPASLSDASPCLPPPKWNLEISTRYCQAHPQSGCCSGTSWTCDNARYVEWFLELCGDG